MLEQVYSQIRTSGLKIFQWVYLLRGQSHDFPSPYFAKNDSDALNATKVARRTAWRPVVMPIAGGHKEGAVTSFDGGESDGAHGVQRPEARILYYTTRVQLASLGTRGVRRTCRASRGPSLLLALSQVTTSTFMIYRRPLVLDSKCKNRMSCHIFDLPLAHTVEKLPGEILASVRLHEPAE